MRPHWLRFLVAVACTWPIIYATALFPALAHWGAQGDHAAVPSRFLVVLSAHVFTIALLIFAWAACVRFAVRSPELSAVGKAVWIALLCLGNLLTLPVFFWLYMWRRSSISRAAA
jgi:hypothetical protein